MKKREKANQRFRCFALIKLSQSRSKFHNVDGFKSIELSKSFNFDNSSDKESTRIIRETPIASIESVFASAHVYIETSEKSSASTNTDPYLQEDVCHRRWISAPESRYPQYCQQHTHQERQSKAQPPLPGGSGSHRLLQTQDT